MFVSPLISIITDQSHSTHSDFKEITNQNTGKAHLSQEDGSSGGPKTKPKALSDPQGDQKGEVGGQVEGDKAKTGNEVAEQEHLLPPQHLAGRDARQHAQGHAHLVLIVQLDSSDTRNLAIC